MTSLNNVVEGGRRAFFGGLCITDNPFKAGSPARLAWARGYRQSREEQRQKAARPRVLHGAGIEWSGERDQ